MHSDSQSAIHLCNNPVYHERTKHVDVKYHFVRDQVVNGAIRIQKISIEDNPADMGTKIVIVTKFKHCMNLLHVSNG